MKTRTGTPQFAPADDIPGTEARVNELLRLGQTRAALEIISPLAQSFTAADRPFRLRGREETRALSHLMIIFLKHAAADDPCARAMRSNMAGADSAARREAERPGATEMRQAQFLSARSFMKI